MNWDVWVAEHQVTGKLYAANRAWTWHPFCAYWWGSKATAVGQMPVPVDVMPVREWAVRQLDRLLAVTPW
jgi:hypothetical protein